MARKGDIKAKTTPVAIGAVREATPVTVVYRDAFGFATPTDYSDMTVEQLRGIATAYHVIAVICRTCGDEAPHCPDVAALFA